MLTDILDDVIGCCLNDHAKTDQKSERLYYDEDDFGLLKDFLVIYIAKVVLDWHSNTIRGLLKEGK